MGARPTGICPMTELASKPDVRALIRSTTLIALADSSLKNSHRSSGVTFAYMRPGASTTSVAVRVSSSWAYDRCFRCDVKAISRRFMGAARSRSMKFSLRKTAYPSLGEAGGLRDFTSCDKPTTRQLTPLYISSDIAGYGRW